MTESRKTLDDHIRTAFEVVSKAKGHIALAIMIFFVSMAAGAVMHERFAAVINYLAAFVENIKDKNTAGIIVSIFQKNLIAMLVVILGGIVFGIIPIASLAMNGALLGVAMMLGFQKGLSVFEFFAAIVPHGMFELPAFFIASGVAMRIGFMQFKCKGREPAKKRMVEGLQVLIFVVLPLLIVAAIIEGLGVAYLR